MTEVAAWAIVQRNQCNGLTLACVNCQAKLGERHNVACYAQAIARQKARRAEERHDR